MNSSIFNFDYVRQYWRLPLSERYWHLGIGVTLLVTFGIVSALLPILSPRTNLYTKAIDALSEDTEILVLGTSHVFSAIRPRLYSRPVVNLSGPVLNYEWMEKILQTHLPHVPNVKVVMIELDIVPLRYNTTSTYNGRNATLRDLGLQVDDESDRASERISHYLSRTVLRPVYYESQRVNLHDYMLALRAIAGYQESTLTFQPREPGKTQIDKHIRATRYPSLVASNQAALLRMIQRLLACHIQVVLIRYPHHPSYWQGRPPAWDEQYEAALRTVQETFGERAPVYWDFEKASIFAEQDFRNGDHPNDAGAAKLVRLIEPELLQLLSELSLARPPHCRSTGPG